MVDFDLSAQRDRGLAEQRSSLGKIERMIAP